MKNCHTNFFLIIRQKNEIRNAFPKNMLSDVKFSKAQMSKLIESGGFLGSWLGKMVGNLGKTVIQTLLFL